MNESELICLFDYQDICIGFRVNKNYFNNGYTESDVIGTGVYMIPKHITPVGRTAKELIKYGKKYVKQVK